MYYVYRPIHVLYVFPSPFLRPVDGTVYLFRLYRANKYANMFLNIILIL